MRTHRKFIPINIGEGLLGRGTEEIITAVKDFKTSGVYKLIHKDIVLYVGQSTSLLRRFIEHDVIQTKSLSKELYYEHITKHNFNRSDIAVNIGDDGIPNVSLPHIIDTIEIAIEYNAGERLKLEKCVIKETRPLFNKQNNAEYRKLKREREEIREYAEGAWGVKDIYKNYKNFKVPPNIKVVNTEQY